MLATRRKSSSLNFSVSSGFLLPTIASLFGPLVFFAASMRSVIQVSCLQRAICLKTLKRSRLSEVNNCMCGVCSHTLRGDLVTVLVWDLPFESV